MNQALVAGVTVTLSVALLHQCRLYGQLPFRQLLDARDMSYPRMPERVFGRFWGYSCSLFGVLTWWGVERWWTLPMFALAYLTSVALQVPLSILSARVPRLAFWLLLFCVMLSETVLAT